MCALIDWIAGLTALSPREQLAVGWEEYRDTSGGEQIHQSQEWLWQCDLPCLVHNARLLAEVSCWGRSHVTSNCPVSFLCLSRESIWRRRSARPTTTPAPLPHSTNLPGHGIIYTNMCTIRLHIYTSLRVGFVRMCVAGWAVGSLAEQECIVVKDPIFRLCISQEIPGFYLLNKPLQNRPCEYVGGDRGMV